MNAKNSVLFLFLFLSLTALAKDVLSVTASTSSVYNVNYKSAEQGRVKISIYNSANTMVFSEVLIDISSFNRPYDFSELKEDVYTIIVEGKDTKQVEQVNYVRKTTPAVINVTEVAEAQGKYLLNVTSYRKQTLLVNVYASNGVLLQRSHVRVNGHKGVIYNLRKVKAAQAPVTFEVITEEGETQTMTF